MPEQLSSFLVAAAYFGLLAFMRMKVFQLQAAVHGRRFRVSGSLRMMMHVLGSLLVPGLGQAIRGRMVPAFIHIGIFTLALACVGEATFLFNLVSSMEHGFTC